MKTKAEIVTKLLEEKTISVEEAIILLMADTQYVYVSQPYPIFPVMPYNPIMTNGPFTTYSTTQQHVN